MSFHGNKTRSSLARMKPITANHHVSNVQKLALRLVKMSVLTKELVKYLNILLWNKEI